MTGDRGPKRSDRGPSRSAVFGLPLGHDYHKGTEFESSEDCLNKPFSLCPLCFCSERILVRLCLGISAESDSPGNEPAQIKRQQ
jgi:hypothetical protein